MLNRTLVHAKKPSNGGSSKNAAGSGSGSSGGGSCLNALWLFAFLAIAALSLTFVAYHHYHEAGVGVKLPDRVPPASSNPSISTINTAIIKNNNEEGKDNLRKITSSSATSSNKKPDSYKKNNEAVVYVRNQSSIPTFTDIHFVHIPKCGGTTMTTVLRKIQCILDPVHNEDCCTNPGFCDWHAHRRCSSIKGCINHFPQR